jgi:hypothetical protein
LLAATVMATSLAVEPPRGDDAANCQLSAQHDLGQTLGSDTARLPMASLRATSQPTVKAVGLMCLPSIHPVAAHGWLAKAAWRVHVSTLSFWRHIRLQI